MVDFMLYISPQFKMLKSNFAVFTASLPPPAMFKHLLILYHPCPKKCFFKGQKFCKRNKTKKLPLLHFIFQLLQIMEISIPTPLPLSHCLIFEQSFVPELSVHLFRMNNISPASLQADKNDPEERPN